MGQTTDKIETFIESKREDLGSNLQELEQKVKSATDWRQQFNKNPMTMLGAALGGGVLLATMLGGRRNRYKQRSASNQLTDAPRSGHDAVSVKALETWGNIKGALVGVAATRFKDLVGEVVPGFHEQLRRIEGNAPQDR